MLDDKDRIFTNIYGFRDWKLAGARARGTWDNTKALIDKGHDWIIDEMKTSGLRGQRWSGLPRPDSSGRSCPRATRGPSYLVVNADEVGAWLLQGPGDHAARAASLHRRLPGRQLRDARAHLLHLRAWRVHPRARAAAGRHRRGLCRQADRQGQHARLGFRLLRASRCRRLHLRRGDGAAGKSGGQEGPAAPEAAVPGQLGLYGAPTTVNNVESHCRGAGHPASRRGLVLGIGKPNNTGTKLFQISGHVERPCVVEDAMGVPLRELIERHAGGVRGGWDNLLAVIPGGSSMPLLPASLCEDLTMDFDSLVKLKSGLGTAAIIVMDKSTDVVKAIARIAYFYKHESCGQCTPCREGTGWMWRVLERMAAGEADKREIDLLFDVSKQIEGHTICALGDAAAWPVQGLLRHFRAEIEARIDRYQAVPRQAPNSPPAAERRRAHDAALRLRQQCRHLSRGHGGAHAGQRDRA